jgi:Xaa-Pro aminopeptidase
MMPQNEFSRRLRNVRTKMKDKGIDILAVYSAPGSIRFGQRGHVMYVSGYEPYFGDTMVILPLDESLTPLLEIDAAYYFPPECTWIENVKPAGDHVQTLKKYLRETKLEKSRVGVAGEYSMSPSLYARMRREIGQIEAASDILESERAVKSEYEIQCIKKTSKIAKKGIEAATKFARAGVSEAEIVGEIERVCRKAGSQGFPHHTMVTSGKDANHLNWWWYCGQRKLKRGDPWLLDFGTMYKGYCCDISRPFTLGSPSQKQKDTFQVLLQAHEAAQKTAREGVLASEVNKAASDVLREAWEGDWWGIGHGVGLEVHEWPFIGYQRILDDEAYRDRRLEANMVISIEPQVYFPEVGDMQIEDQFRVTKTGCERLNDIPTEIIET